MKKFIYNILLFLIIPIVFVLGSWLVYKLKIDNLKFKKDTSIIICGDSHTESGINDSILKNAINISNSSEQYLYTHSVIRQLLKNNSQIRTIILGCGFHSFAKSHDKYMFENNEAQDMYSRYFPMLDYESMSKIASSNSSGILRSFIKTYGRMAKAILTNSKSYLDYPFIGRYYKSDRSNLNDSLVTAAIKRHYYNDNGEEQGFSDFQQFYLNKIVELCMKNNVRLILINTPISDNYYKRIPKKFISNYYNTLSSLNEKIDFWDFHSLHFENACFGDGDHLNAIGAKTLTIKIDSILENKAPLSKKGYTQ